MLYRDPVRLRCNEGSRRALSEPGRLELPLATALALPPDLTVRRSAAPNKALQSQRRTGELLTLVGVAFALRLVLVLLNYRDLPLGNHFEQFGAEMGWTARSLALGRGFSSPFYPQTGPTALVPPLFPLLLAGIFRVFGVYSSASAFAALAVNSLFSALTAGVLFVGLRQRLGLRTARAAASLWVVYPYAIYFSAVYLWDCALTSFLLASCFLLAWNTLPQRSTTYWAGWGMLMGLAVLSNPSVLTLVPVMLGYAAWQRGRDLLPYATRLLAALMLLGLTLAPWCIRNLRTMHEPVLVRDGFWGEFYAGNCGDSSHSNPGWTHPASSPAEMQEYQRRGEAGYMAWKHALSIHRIERYPAAFVETSVRRVVRFWTGYWSFSPAYLRDEGLDVPNVPFCTVLTLLTAFGSVQLYRRDRAAALPFVAAFLLFPLPYYITHASVDYRQPIEPLVVVVVAYGLVALWQRLRHHAEQPRAVQVVA